MIVCSMFGGDDYDELKLQQHDAYDQALQILVRECVKRLKSAEAINGEPLSLGELYRARETAYDHRDLQTAHDLIAAIWRAEQGLTHPPLPISGFHIEKFATEWLTWLKDRARRMDDHTARQLLVCAFGSDEDFEMASSNLVDNLRAELRAILASKEPA